MEEQAENQQVRRMVFHADHAKQKDVSAIAETECFVVQKVTLTEVIATTYFFAKELNR